MSEYFGCRWDGENSAERNTREVNIGITIEKDKFIKDGEPVDGFCLIITGTGDTEHHLVEDALILLKKFAEKKCGGFHA